MTKKRILEAVREICLGLPETSERPSHGAPTFFIRDKRSFATVWDSHHGDGRFALICAAPAGMQAALVEADPDRFYVPPYVGHRGWIGVRLDRGFDRDEVAGIVEDAYAEVAPRLVEADQPGLRESRRSDSNRRPTPYKGVALPAELLRRGASVAVPYRTTSRPFWCARIFRLTRWSALSIVFVSQPSSSAISSYDEPSR